MTKTKRKYTRKPKTFKEVMAKLETVWMECKIEDCPNMELVPAETTGVTCAIHVQTKMPFPKYKSVVARSSKPRGWRFMKEFVAADGTVYHRGEEQSKLKGTLSVTDVDAIREAQKKSLVEKKQKKQKRLVTKYKKKRLLQRSQEALDKGDKKKARELKRQSKALTARKPKAVTIGSYTQVLPT